MSVSCRSPFRFRPQVESLEERVVPAGTLVTTFNKGVLTIAGQSGGQTLAILGAGVGHISISALDGETIQGRNSFVGVRTLNLRLNEGDDVVTLVDVRLNRKGDVLNYNGGSGNDVLLLDGLRLDIRTFNITSGTAATAATDTFSFGQANPIISHFVNVTVNCPNAACFLAISNMGIDGTLNVTTSSTRGDTVYLDDLTVKTFTMNTGGGNDLVIMGKYDQGDGEELVFNGAVNIKLGVGDDFLVAGVGVHDPNGGTDLAPDFTRFMGQVAIDGGAGNDRINVHHPRSTEFVTDDSPTLNGWEEIIYNRFDPVITSDAAVDVDEGSVGVMFITASDLDRDLVTLSIVGGPDASAFGLTDDGILFFLFTPEFANPLDADGNNTYIVQIEADDGRGGTSTKTITVSVNAPAPPGASGD